MSTELRFLQRLNGNKILQTRSTMVIDNEGNWVWTAWADVPMVVEEKDVPPENWIIK